MRRLTLGSYDPAARDDMGQAPLPSRAWVLLWIGTANFPAGNVEQTARGVAVYQGLKGISEPTPGQEGNRRLKPAGGSLLLEEQEFNLLRDALGKMREQIPIANGDALMYLDKAFKSAETLSSEDLQKEVAAS